MAKTYATVVGIVLLIWGVIGLFTNSFLGIALGAATLQTWLFVVAGLLGVWLGFADKSVMGYAKLFGVIFTLGGILGFVASGVMDALTLDSSLVANLVHLIAGLWGLWAGFSSRGGEMMTPPPSSPMA